MWLDIIKVILDISNKKQQIKENKKLKISDVFLQISQLLDETADSLENDIYPLGSCFKMTALSEDFLITIKEDIDDETWNKLSRMLYESCRLEKEYANRNDKETIETIRQTSAHFHAQSLIFKLR
jgi:hypothetical protein